VGGDIDVRGFAARQKWTGSATEEGPTLRSRRDAPRFGMFSGRVAHGTGAGRAAHDAVGF
jgi:hypothetical protein